MSTSQGAPTETPPRLEPSWTRSLESIPTLPTVAGRLIEMALSESTSTEELGEVLSKDPGLTAKLLRVVNSAAYGMRSEVKGVTHAVSIMGRQALRSLVLGISIFETARGQKEADNKPREVLWRHAVATAAAAQIIAEAVGRVNGEEAYIAGLMHDIGKVALELLKPQEYRRAIAEVAPPRAGECRDAETRHCGVDHTAVGEMLAERWSLPAGIRAAIRYHHDSGAMASVPTPIKRIVAIVKAADVVSTRCGYGSSEDVNPPDVDRVTQELLARLNEESVLTRVKEEVRKCAQVFRYDEKVDPEVWQSRLYAANGELSKALASLGETHRIQQRCTELILRIQTLLGSKDTIEAVLAELVRSMGFDRASFLEVSEDGRQAIPTEIVTADGRGSRLEGQALPIDDPAAIPKDHPVAFGRGEGRTQDRWVSFFTVASIVVSPVVEEGRVRYLLATDRGPKPAAETLATDLLVHQLFAPAFALLLQNDRLFKQAQYLSVTDVLTGVSNRRALMDTIERVSREAMESHQAFCVAMLDLDEFKKLNDECGHQAGDEVLRSVAQTIRTVCRGDDVVGRYGGEEFCLVLPETTLEEGTEVSERVRAAVEQLGRAQASKFRNRVATVSVGLAALRFGGEDHESLLARADAALYRAKQSGRNRVHVDSEGAAQR